MPPHFFVWEVVPEPVHGLRLSFLVQVPADVREQIKAWGESSPGESEAKNVAELFVESQSVSA